MLLAVAGLSLPSPIRQVNKALKTAATALLVATASRAGAIAAPNAEQHAAVASRTLRADEVYSPRRDTPTRSQDPAHVHLDDLKGISDITAKYTSPAYLFSDKLGPVGELEEELQDCEYESLRKGREGFGKQIITVGSTAATLYYGAKGLTAIERWFKLQEMRDIEAEIEMSGQYISVDAGDVETSIDPKTGQNITISSAKRNNDTASGDIDVVSSNLPGWLPGWLRSILEAAPTEEEFFDKGTLPGMANRKGKKSSGSKGDVLTDGDSVNDFQELDDTSDDTSGLDTLDGLLGGK